MQYSVVVSPPENDSFQSRFMFHISFIFFAMESLSSAVRFWRKILCCGLY